VRCQLFSISTVVPVSDSARHIVDLNLMIRKAQIVERCSLLEHQESRRKTRTTTIFDHEKLNTLHLEQLKRSVVHMNMHIEQVTGEGGGTDNPPVSGINISYIISVTLSYCLLFRLYRI
jgi:hypothetical protein